MKRTKQIEEYLEGSMSLEERKEFEKQLVDDSELAALVKLHTEVNESIRDQELHTLRSLLKKTSGMTFPEVSRTDSASPVRQILRFQVVRLVAGLLLIAGMGFGIRMLFFEKMTGDALFNKYYMPYDPDVVERSNETDASLLENAILLYQQGFYARAEQSLSNMQADSSLQNLLLFYKGLADLELGKPDESIAAFNEVPQNWGDPHAAHLQWYLALSYLKLEMHDPAEEILANIHQQGGYYAKRAAKVRRHLK